VKNWQHRLFFASGLILAASCALPSFAQQPDPATLHPASMRSTTDPGPAPKRKEKKVWTEDSISQVRTPADNYLDQKAAAEAASKATPDKPAVAAANPAVKPGIGAPPLVLQIPKSAEETQQAIDKRKGMWETFDNLLSNTQERLKTETDPVVRATLLEKEALLKEDISTTTSELKTLEKVLDDFHHGKNPNEPKPEEQANASDQAKPAEQTTASAATN
jgi:hypothetical protein